MVIGSSYSDPGFAEESKIFLGFFYESEFWKATDRDIEERLKFGAIK